MDKKQGQQLLQVLKHRFDQFPNRHPMVPWDAVSAKLEASPSALKVLDQMERTGGEPDVVDWIPQTGTLTFFDCSAESPEGRRGLCYDALALASRKENKPKGSAVQMALEMGVSLLTEEQYRALQQLGEFDTKTSSWVQTPTSIRTLGGALFCDRRYATVFTYHNGVQSYYAARGFRAAFQL